MDTRSDNSNSLLYHRKSEKSDSFMELPGTRPGEEPITFKYISNLGKGAYGVVAKFGRNNSMFAVKKPHEKKIVSPTGNDISKTIHRLERELELLKTAYPGSPYGLIKFLDNASEFDYRLVMPIVAGVQACDVTDTLAEPQLFALVILNILLELQRIHALGIIHGDVSPSNMMVEPESLVVKFIDFNFARLTGRKMQVFDLDEPKKSYMPPERVNVKACRAHPSQDIYSLGWTIDFLIRRRMIQHPYLAEIGNEFSCITDFAEQCLQDNPAKRPTLQSLINQLQPLLTVQILKHKILNHDINETYQILADHQETTSTEELLRLCYEFIQSNKYEFLQRIFTFIESQALDQKSKTVLELYHCISAQKTLADNATKEYSLGFFKAFGSLHPILDKLTNALNLARAVNNPDYKFSADNLAEIKSTPKLFEIYNKLIASGIQINIAQKRGQIQLI